MSIIDKIFYSDKFNVVTGKLERKLSIGKLLVIGFVGLILLGVISAALIVDHTVNTVDKTVDKVLNPFNISSNDSSVQYNSTVDNKEVSSSLKTTVNPDGSITYNGHGTVGGVTATYTDYTIHKDGSTTGTADIDINS